jgi:IS5 family transposase
MPPKSPPSEQPELFRSALVNLVDRRHPLVRLAGLIDWERFATAFGPLYREGGRPGLPTRLMVGLQLVKHLIALFTGDSLPSSGSLALVPFRPATQCGEQSNETTK